MSNVVSLGESRWVRFLNGLGRVGGKCLPNALPWRPEHLRTRPEINALIRSKISEPYQGVKVIEFDHLSPDDP